VLELTVMILPSKVGLSFPIPMQPIRTIEPSHSLILLLDSLSIFFNSSRRVFNVR
jgi:hypothetical protein